MGERNMNRLRAMNLMELLIATVLVGVTICLVLTNVIPTPAERKCRESVKALLTSRGNDITVSEVESYKVRYCH